MKRKEDCIGQDFQGWPVYKMTLREILEALGFIREDGLYYMNDTNSLLDVYPRRLTDDGMGYGVDEEWITEVSCAKDQEGNNIINIFTDKDTRDRNNNIIHTEENKEK